MLWSHYFCFIALYPKFDLKLIRPERYQGEFAIMVLLSEVGLMIFTIYFIIKEIREYKKLKMLYFKVTEIFVYLLEY